MNSLSHVPYHIYLLRYEDILSKSLIQYWDYKSSKNKICYLYYKLWSDINIIKRYQETKNYIRRKIVRVIIVQTKIKIKFINDISPTNIYNRFHIKFGNSFKDFHLSLNYIFQFLKFNA